MLHLILASSTFFSRFRSLLTAFWYFIISLLAFIYQTKISIDLSNRRWDEICPSMTSVTATVKKNAKEASSPGSHQLGSLSIESVSIVFRTTIVIQLLAICSTLSTGLETSGLTSNILDNISTNGLFCSSVRFYQWYFSLNDVHRCI